MKNKLINENEIGYKMCSKCTCDTTVPGINFDSNGECNFCHLQKKMANDFPNDERGEKIIQDTVKKIKAAGKGKKYDCVIGISGGRDSMYTLHYTKKILGLNPIAVHFNDGFGNPTAGQNMIKGCKTLGVELRTITSDWKESKDLRISLLKSSTIDVGLSTDIGIATALYGVAAKENIKYVVIGQSFRTEGIAPLSWNFLDGKYLKDVHSKYGSQPLRKWTPNDPGFNLGLKEMFYYTVTRGIKTFPILYYADYVRKDVDKLIAEELDWKDTGAHYFDDLYQALMTQIFRTKFNIDRRKYNYAALIRSGQMQKEEALERIKTPYVIEDEKVINLCIKRLGLTREQYDSYINQPPKNFRDFKSNYKLIKALKLPIFIASKLNILPGSAYDKYFNCGE